jgi:hypothetical protein
MRLLFAPPNAGSATAFTTVADRNFVATDGLRFGERYGAAASLDSAGYVAAHRTCGAVNIERSPTRRFRTVRHIRVSVILGRSWICPCIRGGAAHRDPLRRPRLVRRGIRGFGGVIEVGRRCDASIEDELRSACQ